MSFDTLSAVIDTAESRIARERLVALVSGKHWDDLAVTGFVDGITRTGMLEPLPITPEWQTTATGSYARLKKADYDFTTTPAGSGTSTDRSKWVEHNATSLAGDIYLQNLDVHDVAITLAKYEKNQPFYLSWFSFNSGKDVQIQVECGWVANNAQSVTLRFWTDGKVDIYKDSPQGEPVQLGQGNIFERHVTTQTVYGKTKTSENFKKASKGDASQQAQKVISVLLIPFKRRQMLFLSNVGGGFSFTFEDIDENDPDPTITPAQSNFFWYVPEGKASVQAAPLRYKTSGALISIVKDLRLPPGVDSQGNTVDETIETNVYCDFSGPDGTATATCTTVETDGSTTFAPDGIKKTCKLRVDMTGDGNNTPFVYGAVSVFDAILQDTDDSEAFALDDYLTKLELAVPESPTDVEMTATLKAPQAAEDAGAAFLRQVGNRPVEVGIGNVAILTGRSQAPNWTESPGGDVARDLVLSWKDRCQALDDYRFLDGVPLDGLMLADAFAAIATLPGYSASEMDMETIYFPLPTVGQNSHGEWALLPEVGDKALDWIKRLWETFARHTLWGWVPTLNGPRFRVYSLDTLDSLPSTFRLYATIQAAVDDGIDREFAFRHVFRSYKETVIKCEANDIWVSGRDIKRGVTGKYIQAHYADVDSQNPALIPSARPANWVGEPRRYGWVDPAITDQDTANWVCATLARRLTPARVLLEWQCDFMLKDNGEPVWRGDIITLDGIGDTRVMTLSGNFELEDPDGIWRPFKYTGELLP